jgi:hypothetical protein
MKKTIILDYYEAIKFMEKYADIVKGSATMNGYTIISYEL